MSTLPTVELGVLGPLQVRQYGVPVAIPGAKPRAILTMLGLHCGSVLSADTLATLLWGENPPRTAAKALQTHISSLRRTLGDGIVLTEGAGWTLAGTEVDASRYKLAAKMGRDAAAAGDTSQAVARLEEALTRWRGIPELPDSQRGVAEKTRWIEGHAALVEDRADALLATGRAAEIIGELESAVADAPLRERRWGQLMLALYRAGRQGEALGAYQRARSLLADELGVDPGPDLRRLETAIVAQDDALDIPVVQHLSSMTRTVTFLLTDIEGSTAAWEADADAMAVALARHDELVEQVVTSRGGRLIKTRGEGDATFSVFDRPSAAAAAAIELQDAIVHEPWALFEPMRIRIALHTGEVELRDGDYFGRAVNRAARLRSLAAGGQILCSGATAELVIDSLRDDVVLVDLGTRQLRNLARPEHVFELRLESADDNPQAPACDAPMERPGLPAVLTGPGPFVGRGRELARLMSTWQTALASGTHAVLIAGEPGVGKTRLAGEWSQQVYEQGAVVLYGRCDEDLGAPYQPFAEALRSLVPCLGASRLRGLRGVEALLPLVPGLADVLPDLAAPTRADPDTERYALFDAVVALMGIASAHAPVVLILDDLHWAAKPTLLLLRHLLRFGEHARVQVVGTYRSTDLDRSHPLAAMLADLHRDGTAHRVQLSGLDEDDVTAYVAEAGYNDEELARALASVTGGNPFFLIEALRHVDESGGRWDPNTLPQGVREAVSRRLSRLPAETNKALAAAAVVGSRFALDLVERVADQDLVDAFDEACQAGIVVEEPGGRYRFNHAIVRQSLLAELASVRRMRLHQRIATTLEAQSGADDELLAELAYHYYECAWAGNAVKAVDYCRRAADQAMTRLAYEGAADLYDRAVHALEEIDGELPDRADQAAQLMIARCEALLAAGDVASAAGAVSQLQEGTVDSARLAAWATCFDGQLSMLTHPERLDEVETAVAAAANKLAELADAAGEAKAHTVRAGCLARLGRIGDCEIALDAALAAARRAREHRQVNAVLAGAPLAALWGPTPVPRAGGRCLDVVRLLRITTDSPAVEATSTRCQAVLEAFRGRAAAARRMIDSARRTTAELGLRHAVLEVEHFAGIVELVVDDPGAAEVHLRKAYNGFRRMGLDADTAETAALLGRACLTLDRYAEADELCRESERLAGHALKASIAWRTLRAQLLSRGNEHDEARRVAEAAVSLAERTDALVDHGDACLALATVLGTAGDVAESRASAERAVGLYERKGAMALAEKARRILGEGAVPPPGATPEPPGLQVVNACVRVIRHLDDALGRDAWDEVEQLFAPEISAEDRRKIVGFPQVIFSPAEWARGVRRIREMGAWRLRRTVIAVRGERLALSRLVVGPAVADPGAPEEDLLHLFGLDTQGRIALHVAFDVEDIDAAYAELDAAHARFEEPSQRVLLENAASRADVRFNALFADRRWDEIGALLTDDIRVEDRRRGLHREGNDRATEIAELRAIGDVGVTNMTSDVLAIRGERLAIVRTLYTGRDKRPEAFRTEVIRIAEIGTDGRIVAYVAFDPDDFEAAIAELEARYIAGEAAPHARTWSVIAANFAATGRRELPTMTPDCVTVDHRRTAAFAPGELIAYLRTGSDLDLTIPPYVETVHRLSDLGAVCTYAAHGVSQEGFDAEWHEIAVSTVKGDMVNRSELFDAADIDAALAKFDELHPQAHRLENEASRANERLHAYFAARDWKAMENALAEDICSDDRRRVVNAGLRRGRDAAIENFRWAANLGGGPATSNTIATRGKCLVLARVRYTPNENPELFQVDLLQVVEIDADQRITTLVTFELEDIDAAFAELDARYIVGEASAHARTWSVIAGSAVAHNRRELPATTADLVSIDHRQVAAFAPGEGLEYVRAGWDLGQHINMYIETEHRVSDLGAVFTWTANGTSQQGFAAEWRGINLLTVEGDMFTRCEVFDEADIHSALAKFDQLSPPLSRLENAASRATDRYLERAFARDWDVIAGMLADDYYTDDRRQLVGGGIHGRDAEIASVQVQVNLGVTHAMPTVAAVRGERLALSRVRYAARDQELEAFVTEILVVFEINADDRFAAAVAFDLDDIEAAFTELDARYVAGEAAAHSHSWSVITSGYAAFNRHEFPAPDWVNIDHRRARAFAPGELTAYMHATWDLAPNVRVYVEAVHRLSNLGAVVTHVVRGTSREGFDAEWQEVILFTVDGDLINHCEVFDEIDLDAALARFEQLSRPAPRLNNAASRLYERLQSYFAARDWNALTETMAVDIYRDDRRRVVNAEANRGREAAVAEARAGADFGAKNAALTVIAIRGERLALIRSRVSGRDQRPEAFHAESLCVVEVDGDGMMARHIMFDPDDFDAAFEELDARYRAGEAGEHAHTWSVITEVFAAVNRHELPGTAPDWVIVDHRLLATFEAGDLPAFLHATWDLTAQAGIYVEAVHRLSDLGAVVTHASHATSQDGLDAEWHDINLVTVDGKLVDRCEIFDDTDLDAALARFEELRPKARRLENAASQLTERYLAHFAARRWEAMAKILADNSFTDDRRRLVGIGTRHDPDVIIADWQAVADVGTKDVTLSVVATRGERLALCRLAFSGRDQRPEAFRSDVLGIVEVNADNRIAACLMFDLDDFNTALDELEFRYLAGEAAAHSQTWSVITDTYSAFNRHELPVVDWVNIDHRRGTPFAPSDLIAVIRGLWDLTPEFRTHLEAVHLLSNFGAVITHHSYGSSYEGSDVEWRMIQLLTVERDRITRCELFDEADLDTALARFDELQRRAPLLDSAATRAWARVVDAFNRRDPEGLLAVGAPDARIEDRRKGLRDVLEGAARRKSVYAMFETAPSGWRMEVQPIALRGSRLSLIRACYRDTDDADRPIAVEALHVMELGDAGLMRETVAFDPDDINAAADELTARWIASGEVAHPEVIAAVGRLNEIANRHDWDAVATCLTGATYVNHRQLADAGADTIAEYLASIRMLASLVPNLRAEIAEVLTHSAIGLVAHMILTGTSNDGVAIEISIVQITLLDADRVTHVEAFDPADRDVALARFEELNRP